MAEKLSERVAFEPFGTLAGVLSGEPFKIFPTGTWYRGSRKLELTPERLREFSANVKAGLPRYRIPINIEHDRSQGSYGAVDDVEYVENGADGPGLYATRYTLTDAGRQLVEQGKFPGISGEAIWSLNGGAKYQDPKTGKYHDNVLAGVALTATPFFGKDVALFTAQPPTETDTMADDTAKPRRGNGFTAFRDKMKSFLAEIDAYLKDADGDGVPDEMPAMPAETPTLAAGASVDKKHEGMSADTAPVAGVTAETPPVGGKPAADAAVQGAETMADNDQTPATPPAPEQMTQVVSVEEFAAVKAQLEAEQKARADLAEKFAAEQRKSRLAGWTAKVENFHAVPTDGLVDKFMALEDAAPDLAEFFAQTIAALDTKIVTGDLFTQRGSARKATANVETLADLASQFVADKFDGDMGKWEQAMNLAGEKRPDLLAAYLRSAPVDKE